MADSKVVKVVTKSDKKTFKIRCRWLKIECNYYKRINNKDKANETTSLLEEFKALKKKAIFKDEEKKVILQYRFLRVLGYGSTRIINLEKTSANSTITFNSDNTKVTFSKDCVAEWKRRKIIIDKVNKIIEKKS